MWRGLLRWFVMPDLSDAAINAAARLLAEHFGYDYGYAESADDDDPYSARYWRDLASEAARAALPHLEAAIRADERKACAREVEAMPDVHPKLVAARLRAGEQTTTTPEVDHDATR